jgi:predicted enzyme related to lactoylglutathione lyase
MVYFAVDDTDDAVAKVKDHGGSVFVEPMDIGVGRLAAVTDPQGAVFSVIDLNYPEPR